MEEVTEQSGRNRVRLFIVLLACVSIALAGWRYWSLMSGAPDSTFDDSYMFTRYAKHILAGHGHAWNAGGEQTYGITSLLYVFVVTALRWATSLSDADLLRTASASLGVLAIGVLALSASRFAKSDALRGSRLLWAGIFAPTMLLSGPFIYHALTGMDTMLAVFMHSVLIYVTLRFVELGTARALWPVVLAGYLAFLTRPDSALYAALFPAAAILLLTDPTKRVRLLIKFWCALGLVILIDAGIKYAIFGVPVPLPTYAKMHGHYTEYAGLAMWNPVEYLLEFLAMALPFICVVIAFTKKRSLALLAVLLIPAILTLSTYFNIVQIMGYRARFSLPSLPFFAIAGALMLDRFVYESKERPSSLALAARVLVILSLVALMPPARELIPPIYKARLAAKAPASVPPENPGGLPTLSYWRSVAAMISIAQNAPAESLFCMSEYGSVGSFAPDLQIYDPLGLHDPQTAKEGFSARVLFERDPDLIWMPHPDYVAMRREILAAEEFQSDYDFYPAALRFGVAIRKHGEHSARLNELFAAAFKNCYPNAVMEKNLLAR